MIGMEHTGCQPVKKLGDYILVAAGDAGLLVYEVSDPTAPSEVGSCETSGDATSVSVSGQHAYVTSGGNRLNVIEISDPNTPANLGSHLANDHDPTGAIGVVMSGTNALIFDVMFPGGTTGEGVEVARSGGLQVIDVSNSAAPVEVHPGRGNAPSIDGPVIAAAIQGTTAYLGVAQRIVVADISDPQNPLPLGSVVVAPTGDDTVESSRPSIVDSE